MIIPSGVNDDFSKMITILCQNVWFDIFELNITWRNVCNIYQSIDRAALLNFTTIKLHYQHMYSIMFNKTALERRKTLGHLRSINRNMIIHFANQSQTCELLKKKKKKIRTFHEKNLWKVVQSIPDWTDRENPYRLSYHIYIYMCVSSSWHNSLTF